MTLATTIFIIYFTIGLLVSLWVFLHDAEDYKEVIAEFGFLGALAGAVISCFVWPVMVVWYIWSRWTGRL